MPRPLDPETWRRIRHLFEEALELPPRERLAWLARSESDEPVRSVVARMLSRDDSGGGLSAADDHDLPLHVAELARKAGISPPEPKDMEADLRGRRIGAYRLVRLLGRGGMGAVYLAERADGQFEKRVAVKLLPLGMDSEQTRRRFLTERQVLAGLEHPNIARLLDGGIAEDGTPYFVMEWVEGRPIDRHCDEERLRFRERLELFLEVCRAVQYAHQNLVVHRDLKPSNVLVRPEGRVKLLDFGIAKLLSDDPAVPGTRTGMRMMTPRYAAPEQIRGGPVTTATDVYALGVLLYELLAGVGPFGPPSGDGLEAERAALEKEPRPPGSTVGRAEGNPGAGEPAIDWREIAACRRTTPEGLRRRLRGDLDNIVLKALEKDPARRYPSARELEEDVRRHLEGRPIVARPQGRAYRAAKFVRRHRVGVGLAAVVGVLVIGFAAAMVRSQATTARERDRAREEAQKANEVTNYLVNLFQAAAPGESGVAELSARELLERGAARMDTELVGQPETRAELMAKLGAIYIELGLYDQAETYLEQSLALRRELLGPQHVDVASSLYGLGRLHFWQGRYDSAQALLSKALESRLSLLDEVDPAIVDNLNGLAVVHWAKGEYDEAERLYNRTLDLRRRLFGNEHPDVAQSLNNLAALASARGDYATAERLARESLEIRRGLFGDEHPEVTRSMHNVAILMRNRGDLSGAEALMERTVDIRRKVLGATHPELALSLVALGELRRRSGALDAAEAHLEEALEIQRGSVGEDHPNVAIALNHLARVKHDVADHGRAEDLFRRARDIALRKLSEEHPDVAAISVGLGACLAAQGRYDEAEPFLLQGYRYGTGEDREDARLALVDLYTDWRKPEKAEEYAAR